MSDEQQIRQQAALWLATLQSGNVDAATEAQFLGWQAADERHARTMQQLYQRMGVLQGSALRDLRAEHLAATLAAPSRRRFIGGALAIIGTGLGGWLLTRTTSTGLALPGDLYTGIGERQRFTLADGSQLTLNASSRVSPDSRALRLRQGELLLDIAPSTTDLFKVQTDFCRISSLGSSVMIRQQDDACYAQALEGSFNVEDVRGERYAVSARQWLSISRAGEVHQGRIKGHETAWLNGLLIVENRPLSEVLERLRPYHRGLLRLDTDIARLNVSGTFPLDDTRHALEMLAAALPVRIVERTPLWIRLEPV